MGNSRGSRFPRISAGNRRKVGWDGGPSSTTTALTAAGASLWSIGSLVGSDGGTLVRTRGQFSAFLSVVGAIQDGFVNGAVGIGVVSENAFGVGITAVPHPLTDDSWDGWLFHRYMGQMRGSATTELFRFPMEAFRWEIDSKAMRKLKETDVIVGVTELGTLIGAATVIYQADTRMLIKLP